MEFRFDNNQPIYIQLVEQLRIYIISGKISPGDRLPSVRDLAIKAKVNPNTMQRALSELEDDKLISTERTNGKFVTTNVRLIQKFRDKSASIKTKTYLKQMAELGFNRDEIIKYLK